MLRGEIPGSSCGLRLGEPVTRAAGSEAEAAAGSARGGGRSGVSVVARRSGLLVARELWKRVVACGCSGDCDKERERQRPPWVSGGQRRRGGASCG